MEAKNLSFSYGEYDFFNDLNISLEDGKITTILGPNGSGKSTLLNLFVRQFSPSKGEIFIDGSSIAKMKQKEIAKRLSVVHQHNIAPGDLTVENLVSYGRVPHQSFWKNKDENDQECIDWAMKSTNIHHLKDKYVNTLSGGERQRTWIAMALAQKTNLLFLDEPTTYLDISYQMEVLNLVKELNRKYGITIVMVLHDINQAMQYSDKLLIMKSGKIRYSGDTENGITKEILNEIYGIDVVIRYCPINHCKYIIPIQLRKENSV
jgi:iron complex transport system ATP-binding protein